MANASKKPQICLGIETTAHTFGIGIVDSNGKVLANEKHAYTSEGEGMIPRLVAEHHIEVFDEILQRALSKADVSLKDIDVVAVSYGPGMGNVLKIGMIIAKMICLTYKIPLALVNHCIAHLEIGKLTTDAKDPVLLYASGANTQVIAYEADAYRIFGETLDIGVGNFIDVFARYIGLGFPGGPKIEALAKEKRGTDLVEIPYNVKGMDIALGGLLTNLKKKFDDGIAKEELAYSLQETVFAMLLEISERAMAHCNKTELLLGGGVACNSRLKEMARKMCDVNGYAFFCPENQFLVDNAAMIAWNGIIKYLNKNYVEVEDIEKANIAPYIRTDSEK